jgi:hypothetical protein
MFGTTATGAATMCVDALECGPTARTTPRDCLTAIYCILIFGKDRKYSSGVAMPMVTGGDCRTATHLRGFDACAAPGRACPV